MDVDAVSHLEKEKIGLDSIYPIKYGEMAFPDWLSLETLRFIERNLASKENMSI